MAVRALILFAHGSRDARWAEPFERVRALVTAAAGETRVELAYLELMSPDLAAVLESVVSSGIIRIDIVPLFLGQGGHLRRDLPALVAGLQAAHPGVDIRCAPAAGEDPGVLAALASYCLQTAR